MKALALVVLTISAAACSDDEPNGTGLDGGSQSDSLDAGPNSMGSSDALAGYKTERDADGGFRLTTPTGEVCSTYVGTGSLVITSARADDGKVCVVVDNTLLVEDSVCVRLDAGPLESSARKEACSRMIFGF